MTKKWKNSDFNEDKNSNKNIFDIGCEISQAAVHNFYLTRAQDFHPTRNQVDYGALVAIPYKKKAELIELQPNTLQPEVKTENSWYVSMGSGQPVADPLLGFVRRVFWGDDPPSCKDAVFAVTMILELACEMAPLGVAKPIYIATLSPDPRKRGKLSARLLSNDELEEHKDHVEQVLEYFKGYPKESTSATTTDQQLPQAPDVSSITGA